VQGTFSSAPQTSGKVTVKPVNSWTELAEDELASSGLEVSLPPVMPQEPNKRAQVATSGKSILFFMVIILSLIVNYDNEGSANLVPIDNEELQQGSSLCFLDVKEIKGQKE
jgi:hypothetical protein